MKTMPSQSQARHVHRNTRRSLPFRKAAPLAYISGTLGVLIGADFLHLPGLLNATISKPTNAVIGGAVVFDMIYITGILAVIVDGIIMFKQRSREKID